MAFENTVVDKITEKDIQDLVDNEIPEGISLDYKRKPFEKGEKDEDKKSRTLRRYFRVREYSRRSYYLRRR